jgi:hypothetical protein
MKVCDTHYDYYLKSEAEYSLHPKLHKTYDAFPANILDLQNIIFYGPPDVGKYTQMLRSICKYSPTALKYDKKIIILCNKLSYTIKISDIHFEVDMSLLGCNSKSLWNDIYNHIVDVMLANKTHRGIIVCKYFQEIPSELLDCFYSYMQTLSNSSISIKYILLTEEISFIPDAISNRCHIISVPRPSKPRYANCDNLKTYKDGTIIPGSISKINAELILRLSKPYELICNTILDKINNIDTLGFTDMRDKLYDLHIYNLDVTDCIWYILHKLISQNKIPNDKISGVILQIYKILQYYNNNYRPIYHLESFVFYLINTIYGFTEGM